MHDGKHAPRRSRALSSDSLNASRRNSSASTIVLFPAPFLPTSTVRSSSVTRAFSNARKSESRSSSIRTCGPSDFIRPLYHSGGTASRCVLAPARREGGSLTAVVSGEVTLDPALPPA